MGQDTVYIVWETTSCYGTRQCGYCLGANSFLWDKTLWILFQSQLLFMGRDNADIAPEQTPFLWDKTMWILFQSQLLFTGQDNVDMFKSKLLFKGQDTGYCLRANSFYGTRQCGYCLRANSFYGTRQCGFFQQKCLFNARNSMQLTWKQWKRRNDFSVDVVCIGI